MRQFDVLRVGGDLFAIIQADHLLDLNSVIVVPVLPREVYPALRKLTVDTEIDDVPLRIRAHMPLTIEASRLRHLQPVARLSPDDGQKVIDGLSTVVWGF